MTQALVITSGWTMRPIIRCAFEGHIHRVDICQGVATSFFQTAQGTIWPLCSACSDRFKSMVGTCLSSGDIGPNHVTAARFDIPLDDPDTLRAYHSQDPAKLARVLKLAEEWYWRGVTPPPVRN